MPFSTSKGGKIGRKKMATVIDFTFDFYLNKSDKQIHHPFQLENMIGYPDTGPPGWVHDEWEHLYWDDAFLASASLDQSAVASMTFSILDAVNCNSLRFLRIF